uniref:Uncharacterized protein n=2 Tax=Rhynchosporium TaxID=38037 RepID=V5W772_9HELO|nr:hypothetical protein [Rhynchosporium agropyri]YP_008965381.1 hypothetical protein [Rhynchosporium commune]AHC02332.1 hypothetical protein [Rhynchosporium agropyri]AHC02378.1 hypothetical protein [Rhynchosporium commune]
MNTYIYFFLSLKIIFRYSCLMVSYVVHKSSKLPDKMLKLSTNFIWYLTLTSLLTTTPFLTIALGVPVIVILRNLDPWQDNLTWYLSDLIKRRNKKYISKPPKLCT